MGYENQNSILNFNRFKQDVEPHFLKNNIQIGSNPKTNFTTFDDVLKSVFSTISTFPHSTFYISYNIENSDILIEVHPVTESA